MPTRIKRYEAPLRDLDRLLARIENEMGPSAEIETRQFSRRRLLGLFGGERMVEVIAVLEVSDKRRQAQPGPAEQPLPAARAYSAAAASQVQAATPPAGRPRRVDVSADAPVELQPASDDAVARITADARQFSQTAAVASAPEPQVSAQQPVPAPEPGAPTVQAEIVDAVASPEPDAAAIESEIGGLRESISELKETIELLVKQQNAVATQIAVAERPVVSQAGDAEAKQHGAAAEAAEEAEKMAETVAPLFSGMPAAGATAPEVADPVAIDHAAALPAVERRVYDRLLDWNIGAYDALELINTALDEWRGQEKTTEDSLLKLITGDICRNILLSGGIRLGSAPPGKAVALIGATGVGKTTTIAKLAAQFTFQGGKRVSLVSLDNYRIAAAEQLRTYAEIMGLSIDIVFGREEFDQVLSERRQSDLVLIDTAGRSPANARQIYQLREVFSAHPPDEVHLVVAASTKADDVRMLLENFAPLSYDHLIVSKLDETTSLGGLYNIVKHCPLPISYFTVGQSVPEDIRTASLGFVRSWIEQGRIS